jgi:hypothetical protein
MAGQHDVYVFQDPNSGFFKVRPGVAFASAGDPFKVRNLTNYEVDVTFQGGLMDEGSGRQAIAAKSQGVFHIQGGASGFYAYSASVVVNGHQWNAIGESDPGVIIDP